MLKSRKTARTLRVAMLICAVVALSTLPSCATSQDQYTGDEEMSRALVAESVDLGPTGESIYVETNENGAYDIVITERNLTDNIELANSENNIVSDEELGIVEEPVEDMRTAEIAEEAGASEVLDEEADVAEVTEEAGAPEVSDEDPAAAEAYDAEADAAEESDEDLDVAELPDDESGNVETSDEEPDSAETLEETGAVEATEETAVAEAAEEVGAEETAEDGAWTLARVKQEDVSVAYSVSVLPEGGEEPVLEVREAEVTGFSNNNGEISLSFQAEEPGPVLSWTFTVNFVGTQAYALVQTSPAPNDIVIEEVDYDAQIAELLAYKPDFTEEDISLPEGTYFEDGTLMVSDDAPQVVQDTLVESGFAEQEMSRAEAAPGNDGSADGGNASNGTNDATLQYMQEYNARKTKYDNYDAVANYAPELAGYINPTASKVTEFGADAYRVFRGYYTGNWGAGIQGSMGILKMFGLFKGPGAQGVSNAQILSEVQKVGLEVADMHALTKAMNEKLDETLLQAYANNLQIFDNAVNSMHANAEMVQRMYTEGAIRAAEAGILPPDEECDAEEEFDYNYDLKTYIKELEAKGGRKNSAFEGFTGYAESLAKDFVLVSGEVSKNETNPILTYDKYWNLYFNFDSQAYYLKRSYRSDIEYELKRAFGLVEIYYNVYDPYTKGNYAEYDTQFFSAIDRLEQLDPGPSPEDIRSAVKYRNKFRVFSSTLNCYVRDIGASYNAQGNSIATGQLSSYLTKLHGKNVYDDLNLAGFISGKRLVMKDENGVSTGIDPRWWGEPSLYTNQCHGIGFNCKYKDSWYSADIIGYDNKLHTGTNTAYKDYSKNLKNPFDADGQTPHEMPYVLFTLG